MSAFFAWTQPAPVLYGSSQDGVLYDVPYLINPNPEELNSMIELLTVEERSRISANEQYKNTLIPISTNPGGAGTNTVTPQLNKEGVK